MKRASIITIQSAIDLFCNTVKSGPEKTSATGIVKTLTPIRTSRKGNNFFNFTLVNGDDAIPGVSFETGCHLEFQSAMLTSKSPVKISGVSIKRRPDSTGSEVIFSKRSKLTSIDGDSTIEDNIPDYSDAMFTKISTIVTLNCGSTVNVRIKVIALGSIEEVTKDGESLKLRNIVLADQSGTIRLSLWQNSVDQFKEQQCYCIFQATIRSYLDIKLLSLTTESIVNISQDIGDVYNAEPATQSCKSSADFCETSKGRIIGCSSVNVFFSCLFCKGNIGTNYSAMSDLTVCKCCSACIRVSDCIYNFSCKLMFAEEGSDHLQLIAHYNDIKWMLADKMDQALSMDFIQRQLLVHNEPMKISHANGILIKLVKVV